MEHFSSQKRLDFRYTQSVSVLIPMRACWARRGFAAADALSPSRSHRERHAKEIDERTPLPSSCNNAARSASMSRKPRARPSDVVMDELVGEQAPWDLDKHLSGCL